MKRNRVYIGAFLLVLGVLVFLEAQQEEPINWNPSYGAADKIPLGSYVLYQELEEALSLQPINIPPYEFLQKSQEPGTYLFINNQLPIDDAELKSLLSWVERGNTAFLASELLGDNLLDTLGIGMEVAVPESGVSSRPVFSLNEPTLQQQDQSYLYDRETFYYIFTGLDSLEHEILGTVQPFSESPLKEQAQVNFIRVPFGTGQIFLHSAPQIFSNFFMLHGDNHQYTEATLSYIPSKTPVYWDAYHKAGKVFNTSPLYILFETPAFKWAYYLVLAGSLLFILFEGKRKQRSIPVIDPPRNTSMEFAATIADLYQEQKDYRSIAQKSITFFYRYLHSIVGPDPSMDSDLVKLVSSRWGIPKTEIKNLLKYMNDLQQKDAVTQRDLKNLNNKINNFKMHINGKYTT